MPRWRRFTDADWIDQTGVGQPTEVGESRLLDGEWLFRDNAAPFNPRHGYTENGVDRNLTVPVGYARMMHDFEIADGIEITVEQGGEMLVL